jgi:hypothetical protein
MMRDNLSPLGFQDHSLSYAEFEGVIPPDQYGAGTVIVWDPRNVIVLHMVIFIIRASEMKKPCKHAEPVWTQ